MLFARTLTAVLGFGLSAAAFAACCTSTDSCGGCKGATACDPLSKTCQPAIPIGSPCGPSGDGGPAITLPCAQGSICLSASPGAAAICATTCDPQGQSCVGSETCAVIALPDGGGTGICLSPATVGAPCAPSQLLDCVSPAVCVTAGGAAAGVCFTPCAPAQSPSACPTGQSCLAVFAAADAGICATPVAPGQGCSQANAAFCPSMQLCLETATADGGTCVLRCDPTQPSGCPESNQCLTPLGAGAPSFCAQPQAIGQPCASAQQLYCPNGALCITGQAGSVSGTCRAECSDAGTCPPGQTCNPTVDPGVDFCL